MTKEFNFISFTNMLKGLQKQLRGLEGSLRELLQIQKANVKGERLKRYLTIDEVGELLEVHRNTVYRYIRSDELPTSMIGRQLYIHEEDLLNLLIKNRRFK